MPHDKQPGEIDPTPGLAGGPGPTPPGVEDGTPHPRKAAPETVPPASEQQAEGEIAERSAGVRRADVPGLAGEREGTHDPDRDPDDDERERRTRR
jgi:hypothetical protein